jgi:prephenate dehydrogenase
MADRPAPAAVVGVGLMGGSLALALRERAGREEVRGFDPDAGALRRAVEVGAITTPAPSLEAAVDGADVVFLAAPVGRLGALAREAVAASGADCVVTDVGSAKHAVVSALPADARERFVGGHPVCGAERTGVEHARADLFVGATYFLTPGPEVRPDVYERLHALIAALGAHPVAIDAGVHDDLMALVSHVPHVLASALINQAAGTAPSGREALRSAGPSFADLTRVGGANPPLWTDILVANREAVLRALEGFASRLAEVGEAISRDDRAWLTAFFEEAAEGRGRLMAPTPPAGVTPWRVVVGVPDRPGAISEIATALGHAHINIDDLSLLPGPPGSGGELRLVVAGEAAATDAVARIAAIGHRVRAEPLG